jgi:hypothetical protein
LALLNWLKNNSFWKWGWGVQETESPKSGGVGNGDTKPHFQFECNKIKIWVYLFAQNKIMFYFSPY